MDNIMIPVEFMKIGYVVAIPLIVTYFVTVLVKNDMVKFFFCFLKTVVYFTLAYFMWKYYQGKDQIDIISAFTFIFCCFESADNLISLLSIPIEYIRKIRNNDEK